MESHHGSKIVQYDSIYISSASHDPASPSRRVRSAVPGYRLDRVPVLMQLPCEAEVYTLMTEGLPPHPNSHRFATNLGDENRCIA